MFWTAPPTGPRGLAPGREGDVGARSLAAYRDVSLQFVQYLEREGYTPHSPEEWDDLVVEWAHADNVTPSTLRSCIAALEFVLPAVKGKLVWARQRLDTAHRIAPPLHAAPAGMDVCVLLGSFMASEGRARLGLAMQVQCALGLRPGELLHLVREDFATEPSEKRRKTHRRSSGPGSRD